ncbi:PepSY domain-containing protein [Sulfuriflexus mobilis]|uniref:PepSY domain-containing protein n=1 Tax=Sulfuriflexus mobilis TaxID=1811807 RepID=UPI000F83933E|nr:PepSY domain-containing protein [Sulfuriflexus mobilis]
MTRHKHKKPFAIKLRSLYLWHRYIGLSVALLTVILAVSGLMLNHTDRLGLDRQHVASEWLLDWYGIEAPARLSSYPVAQEHVSLVEDRLYLGQRVLPGHYTQLVGVLSFDKLIIIAVDQQLLIATSGGEIVERIGEVEGLPAAPLAIGRLGNRQLALRTADGIYLTNVEFTAWQAGSLAPTDIDWSTPGTLPDKLGQTLRRHYQQSTLPVERVVLDIHSGRILGSFGVYLMDIAAILLIILAASGSLIWAQQLHKRLTHRNKKTGN